jgi:type VI secretion system secreted protein VgrG
LITGRVYNAEQMPPYPLPGSSVVMGLKSKTCKGTGSNEMSFDDTKGKEKITVHGQYDMNTTVEHDQTTHVKRNRSTNTDVDDSHSVGGNQSLSVKKKQTITIDGQRDLWVKKDQREQIDGQHSYTCKGDRNEKLTGSVTLQAKGLAVQVTDGYGLDGGKSVHITGQEVVIDAGTSLTIMVGGSFVKIDAGGVTVVGAPQVKINSGGAAGRGAPIRVVEPEPPDAAKPPPQAS